MFDINKKIKYLKKFGLEIIKIDFYRLGKYFVDLIRINQNCLP